MKTSLLLLVPLLAAGTLSPAQAATSASATASNITVTLIDLAPGDGIAPSLTWLPAEFEYGTSLISVTDLISAQYPYLPSEHAAAGAPVDRAVATPHGQSRVQSSGGELAALSLSARTGFDTVDTPVSDARANITSGGYAFVLSPYTSVTFSADVDLRAASTDPLQDVRGEQARAQATLGLTYHDNGALLAGQWPSHDVITGPWNAQEKSEQMTMSVSAYTLEPDGGFFYFETELKTQVSITSSVPEPSTWAMLLLGAALVPVAARRRPAQRREQA